MNQPLILASASPRRREICEKLGLSFSVIPAERELPPEPSLSLEEAVLRVARDKAEQVAADHGEAAVLGADTVVVLDGEPLGKPHSAEEAAAMLSRLSGRTHRVITAVWLCNGENSAGFSDSTEVDFLPLEPAEITAYVAGGEPMDKAGAYGIQGQGMRFIRGIRGDYYTVMGMPAGRLYAFLKEHGIIDR